MGWRVTARWLATASAAARSRVGSIGYIGTIAVPRRSCPLRSAPSLAATPTVRR